MRAAINTGGSGTVNDWGLAAIAAALGAFITGLWAWMTQRSKSRADVEVAVMAEWQKLNGAQSEEIQRLGGRCQRLEAAEERCRTDLSDALKRLSTLEGYEHGQGKARQEAAQIVAIERLSDKKDGGK